MSAPIQKSVVYEAAMKIYLNREVKYPSIAANAKYKIPGSKLTYQQAEMRDAARIAWAMVEAVNFTETEG